MLLNMDCCFGIIGAALRWHLLMNFIYYLLGQHPKKLTPGSRTFYCEHEFSLLFAQTIC